MYNKRFIRLYKRNDKPDWMSKAIWAMADMQLDIILKLHEGRC